MMNAIIYKFSILIGYLYCTFKGICLGNNVKINKLPKIIKLVDSEIIIKDNVSINSNDKGYHLNMHSRCKLYADRSNAIIIIGENTRIHGTCIHAQKSITIGKNCLIAANTNIIDSNGHLLSFDKPWDRINTKDEGKSIVIQDNVWIGANSLILGGVTIGEGSVIAANSVVKNDLPPFCLASGNPAQVIKQYKIINY